MGKLKLGLVSYGSREAAVADAFSRSYHQPELYIASKQANPMNIDIARRTGGRHIVIPNLSDVDALSGFFRDCSPEFVFVGSEAPIIAGFRDKTEGEFGIPVVCPIRKYGIEGSKVQQRMALGEVAPGANPRFGAFPSSGYDEHILKQLFGDLGYKVAIKPDTPTAGKGVGVSGDHFGETEKECLAYFAEVAKGTPRVIVEERIDGEESSLQVFCDGQTMVPSPDARDYKRAFKDDRGPNTGGMGSYCGPDLHLPFMTPGDRAAEIDITHKFFDYLRGEGRNTGIMGVPFYMAFIHGRNGPKVLEVNSRPGDPEFINILPLLEEDLVDICFDMVRGTLSPDGLRMKPQATVVIYKVPPAYGGKDPQYSGSKEVDMRKALAMAADAPHQYGAFPGDMALEDGRTYSIKSRAVACLGIGDDIRQARARALEVVDAVEGGGLWFREDIASAEHICRSVEKMRRLRC